MAIKNVPVTLGVNGPLVGTAEVSGSDVAIYMEPENLVKEVEHLLTIEQIRGFSVELTYRDIEAVERRAGRGRHFHPQPKENVTFDENTLFKVYDSLRIVGGLSEELARDAIADMQNKGILFRERVLEVGYVGPVCR